MSNLYDIWYDAGGGLHLEALVNDDGEKRIASFDAPFNPYCYIREEDFDMNLLQRHGMQLGDGAPDGYLKVEGHHPRDIRDFKDAVHIETFEADVPYARRVLIDEDMSVDPPSDEEILFYDIEVDPRGEFPDPEEATAKILSIACQDGTGEREFFLSSADEYQEQDNPEKAMMEDFVDFIDDYFIISGYNSLRFDQPYIENRCDNLGVWYNWDRVVHLDMYGLYKTLTWTGAQSFQLEDVATEEFGQTEFVGKEYGLDEDMTQIYDWWEDDPELLKDYNVMDTDITQRLDEKYNFVDELYRICGQAHTLPSTIFWSDDSGQTRFAGGQAVDALILTKAREWNVVLPNKGKYADTHDFPGGEVLDPIPGLHDDTITVDFSSMYPNIIRALNLGPNTWVEDPGQYDGELIKGAGMVDEAAEASKGGFKHPDDEKSILAEAVEELMDIRFEAKGKKKAAEPGSEEFKKWENIDAGLKAILNTMYGVFASPYHRYYQPGMSEHVTETGQYMVRVTRDEAETVPGVRRVIYGDTDSVIVQLEPEADVSGMEPDKVAELEEAFGQFEDPPVPDPERAARITDIATKVSDDIEELMNNRIVEEMNAVGEYLELDLDDVYRRYYIGDKKKYYFGHRIIKDDPRESGSPASEIKITGFEAIRNNWPDSASAFQKTCIECELFDRPVGDHIDEAKHKLFTGQFDLDMVQRTSLRSPVDSYETSLPHTRAAEMIREQYGEEEVRVGDKIPYIKYGGDKQDITHAYSEKVGRDFRPGQGYCPECDEVVDRDEHGHEVEDYPHFRDSQYSYMWDKYFKSAMNRVGVHEFEQQSLGAFA